MLNCHPNRLGGWVTLSIAILLISSSLYATVAEAGLARPRQLHPQTQFPDVVEAASSEDPPIGADYAAATDADATVSCCMGCIPAALVETGYSGFRTKYTYLMRQYIFLECSKSIQYFDHVLSSEYVLPVSEHLLGNDSQRKENIAEAKKTVSFISMKNILTLIRANVGKIRQSECEAAAAADACDDEFDDVSQSLDLDDAESVANAIWPFTDVFCSIVESYEAAASEDDAVWPLPGYPEHDNLHTTCIGQLSIAEKVMQMNQHPVPAHTDPGEIAATARKIFDKRYKTPTTAKIPAATVTTPTVDELLAAVQRTRQEGGQARLPGEVDEGSSTIALVHHNNWNTDQPIYNSGLRFVGEARLPEEVDECPPTIALVHHNN
eukprot:GHVQ01018798.1.p1 GENE.GHVQ01018798.1~~GHVQ01018798.1.p1  ORF type:complete len:380 (+),score=55.33 GHVQ01018798.1:190-1329(+)